MLNIEADMIMQHVAVAVIIEHDRVLIAKRADNVHQPGLWEFPGGKVETGETTEQALSREIQEELGIIIEQAQPLIQIAHQYTDQQVLLDVYRVTHFSGRRYDADNNSVRQQGLEGQTVQWLALNELKDYPFPAANSAIIHALNLPERYLISPEADYQSDEHLSGFIDDFSYNCQQQKLLQLRLKSVDGKIFASLFERLAVLAQQQQVKLLINSSMSLSQAQYVKVAGIHLTSRHLYDDEIIDYYRALDRQKLMAASCHCLDDIKRANDLKLDFIALSAVKKTPSHPQQSAMGWQKFQQLVQWAKMPVYALGGMVESDIKVAQTYGAQGIAAISCLWLHNRN